MATDSDFDPYYQWLGIPPSEHPINHYRLLGLALFEENGDVIAHAADRQMAHLKSFAAGHTAQILNSCSMYWPRPACACSTPKQKPPTTISCVRHWLRHPRNH